MEQDIIQRQKNLLNSFREANQKYSSEIKESSHRIETFYSARKNQYLAHSKKIQELWEEARKYLDEKALNSSWVNYNTHTLPDSDVIDDKYVHDLLSIKVPSAITSAERDIYSLRTAIYSKYENYKVKIKLKSLMVWVICILGSIISIIVLINQSSSSNFQMEKSVTYEKLWDKNTSDNKQLRTITVPVENGFPDIRQLVQFAADRGGINNESLIMNAVYTINSKFPCPTQKYKKSARDANNLGIELNSQEQFDQALEKFEIAYNRDPTDIEIINNLGNAYSRAGNLDKAEQFLLRALVYDSARALAWGNLGEVYAKKGDVQLAVAAFSNTLRFTRDTDQTRKFLNSLIIKADDSNLRQAAEQALQLPYIKPTRPKFCSKGK